MGVFRTMFTLENKLLKFILILKTISSISKYTKSTQYTYKLSFL